MSKLLASTTTMQATEAQGIKHTPGPWVYNEERDSRSDGYIRAGEPIAGAQKGISVARANHASRGVAEMRANARLITAAPELLEALKGLAALAADPAGSQFTMREVFGTFQHGCGTPVLEGRKAIAAIAKATGQAS